MENLKQTDAFLESNGKYTHKYKNHKEIYLRFAVSFLVMRVQINPKELYDSLEEQYIVDSFEQRPIIESKEYGIFVTLPV